LVETTAKPHGRFQRAAFYARIGQEIGVTMAAKFNAHPRDLLAKAVAKENRDGGDRTGRTTGLRVTHYVDSLLRQNESQHATDEVLAAALKAEFPKRKVLQAFSSWRGYFNQGLHGHNPDKRFHSASYNESGEPRRKAATATAKGKGKASKGKAKGSKAKASK
jgi:hypothetical protein